MPTETAGEGFALGAKVKNLGEQRNGKGWALTLDHKWPGSQFDTILTGQDWDKVEGLSVGMEIVAAITRGSLKKDRAGNEKSGQYESDFFWNVHTINAPGNGVAGEKPKAQPAPKAAPKEAPRAPMQGQDFGETYRYISWSGMAANALSMIPDLIDAHKNDEKPLKYEDAFLLAMKLQLESVRREVSR